MFTQINKGTKPFNRKIMLSVNILKKLILYIFATNVKFPLDLLFSINNILTQTIIKNEVMSLTYFGVRAF